MRDAQQRTRRGLVASLASGLVAALFFGWYVLLGPGAGAGAGPSAMQAMQAVARASAARTPEPAPVVTSVLAPPVASATPNPAVDRAISLPASDEAGLAALSRESAADGTSIRFERQWAAQLASKYVGIVDPVQVNATGQHRFAATDIFAEHAALESRVTGARVLLLDSRTFGTGRSFEGRPYWVTVAVDESFTNADQIVRWCLAQFPDLSGTALDNQCLPVQLAPLG